MEFSDKLYEALRLEVIKLDNLVISLGTLVLSIIFLALIAAFFLAALYTYRLYLRNRFFDRYHLELPKNFKISRRGSDYQNHFFLVFPSWCWPNKDGS